MKHLRTYGFNIIELAIFIVVIGIIFATFLLPLTVSAPSLSTQQDAFIAIQLAERRTELIIQNRRSNGYGGTVDPCIAKPSATPCVVPSPFSIAVAPVVSGDQTNVTVTVSGPGTAEIRTILASY